MRSAVCEIVTDNCESTARSEPVVDEIISRIYRKHDKKLRSFISRRLRSKEDVDDVVQEVYLRLIRKPDLAKLSISFALLRKIATDLMVDRFRSRHSRVKGSLVLMTIY